MHSHSLRTAPREQLIAELHEFADDRESHGKHDRARGARAAATSLREGADEIPFEDTVYRVSTDTTRQDVRRGARDELLAEAREAHAGWTHLGKRHLAILAWTAVEELEQGATRVQIGHIVYEVAD
jgi:hypothetical protein